MIHFEHWYSNFEKWEIENAEEISFLLANFCSESLISEKDLKIFDYYVKGKKQREISLIFNMHQPLVSRSVNLTKRIIRSVHTFVYHEDARKSLDIAKNILTANEYKILNYRMVGYTFKTIADVLGTSTQYIGIANNNIMKKFERHLKNNNVNLLYTYLRRINSYWKTKGKKNRKIK